MKATNRNIPIENCATKQSAIVPLIGCSSGGLPIIRRQEILEILKSCRRSCIIPGSYVTRTSYSVLRPLSWQVLRFSEMRACKLKFDCLAVECGEKPWNTLSDGISQVLRWVIESVREGLLINQCIGTPFFYKNTFHKNIQA